MAVSAKGVKMAVAMAAVEKAGSNQVVAYFGSEAPPLERISSGSFLLDWALCGGLARGRIYQFAGKPSSGKSSAALNASRETIESGGRVLWAAVEDFDWTYARSVGVRVDEGFALMQSPFGDELCNAIVGAVASGQWDLIVLDSIGALSDSTYSMKDDGVWNESVGKKDRGGIGKLLSDFTKRLCSALNGITSDRVRRGRIQRALDKENKSKRPSKRVVEQLTKAMPASRREPVIVVINQVRDKGLSGGFGGTDSPGGWALKHHKAGDVVFTSVGRLYPGGALKEDDSNTYGKLMPGLLARDTHISIEKHKVGLPYRAGRLRLGQMDAEGMTMGRFFRPYEVIQLGLMYGVVEQNDSWYSIGSAKWQGQANTVAALLSEPELMPAVEAEILKRAGLA